MKTLEEFLTFTSGLVFGTACTIMSKVLLETEVDGKKFAKPLFQTYLMFMGMLLGLPMHYFMLYRKAKQQPPEDYVPLADGATSIQPQKQELTRRMFFFLIIPAFFDFCGTALCMVGLVSVNVSLYQLLKCSVIIFVALAKRLVLGVHLQKHLWVGVALISVAVSMAASSSFFITDENDHPGQKAHSPVVGMLLILLSCVVQSLQYVFEEKVMGEGEITVPPLVVIGMEGFWGLILSTFVMLPIAAVLPGHDCRGLCNGNETGVFENTWDTLELVSSSNKLVVLLVFFIFVVTGYNAACVFVTYLLDAVWHAILDNFRPISVWSTDLLIFLITSGAYGEEWSVYSWLQLAGLVLLLYGTAVYNGNVRLSCIKYDDPGMTPHSSVLTRSPMLTRNTTNSAANKPDFGTSESDDRTSRERLGSV